MPYEVVKTIRGRDYRYQVESYRDPETGKVRNRWKYLGKADGHGERTAVRRRDPGATRQRLLDAFLQLVDSQPWDTVTPGTIAREAGLAHGTFYRHFKNREELLDEVTREAQSALDGRLHQLDEIAPTLDEERERVRTWVVALFKNPSVSPGLLRVWVNDAQASRRERIREQRRTLRIGAFARYIDALRERGFAEESGDVHALAVSLALLLETMNRRTATESTLLSEDDYAAATETFDRLLFWRAP